MLSGRAVTAWPTGAAARDIEHATRAGGLPCAWPASSDESRLLRIPLAAAKLLAGVGRAACCRANRLVAHGSAPCSLQLRQRALHILR